MKNLAFIFLLTCSFSFAHAQQSACMKLIHAVKNGDTQRFSALLDKTNPNCSNVGDGTVLILAAFHGNVSMVNALLKVGADVKQSSDGDGNPLIAAAKSGHIDIVKILLKAGAEIDAHVMGDETALIQAAWNGHLEVVQYLVEKGADVNMAVRDQYKLNSEKRSALKMAKRGNHKEVVAFLIGEGAK